MSNLAYKDRIKKGEFEGKLCDLFGHENLSAAMHKEKHCDSPVLTLYYVDLTPEQAEQNHGIDTMHVGTWQSGTGWIFAYAEQYVLEGQTI